MTIRDILVHLDQGPGALARIELAARLAQRHAAHLVGLFVVDVPLPLFIGGEVGGAAVAAELLTELRDAALADANDLEPRFQERLSRDSIPGEWRQPEGITPAQIALHGRYADLLVVGQGDAQGAGPMPGLAAEAALFGSGRPVLVVPHTWAGGTVGKRVLIAWNASREASRAVHDALPLIAGAESVTVLTINAEATAEGHGEEPGADIARHLARHGLKVTARRVAGSEMAAGDIMLNEASDLGADLLVMGAYGHSRLREVVLGGATRTILASMTVPVLLSH